MTSLLGTNERRRPLPKRMLRYLCSHFEINVGTRVLLVGCGEAGLLGAFERLGVDVTAVEDSPDDVASPTNTRTSADVHFLGPDGRLPFPPAHFDAVLIGELAAYRGDLFSEECLHTTARLLTCVRPGGFCGFFARPTLGRETDRSHTADCYRRHLAAFEEHVRIGSTSAAPLWQRIFRPGLSQRFNTISVRLPAVEVSASEWLGRAGRAAAASTVSCCPSAADSPTSRRAA